MAAVSPFSMPMSVLEEAGDGPQRERRRQGSNFLAAGLHKAAAAGDWAAVQRALVPSVFDPLGLIYHILGFNAHHAMEALNEVNSPTPARRNTGPRSAPPLRPRRTLLTYIDHALVHTERTHPSDRMPSYVRHGWLTLLSCAGAGRACRTGARRCIWRRRVGTRAP